MSKKETWAKFCPSPAATYSVMASPSSLSCENRNPGETGRVVTRVRSEEITSAKPMKKAPTLAEASPYKSVADELEALRRTFRGATQSYAERIDAEIGGLHERVVAAGTVAARHEKEEGAAATRPSASTQNRKARTLARVHELRDMLTLLRTMQVKPAEGRRKDLKKIESVIQDLQLLSAKWG